MKKILQLLSFVRFPIQFVNPFPFVFFKMYYKAFGSFSEGILWEGLDQIQNSGWAVAMQSRFHTQFSHRASDYYFLDYRFLEQIGFFTKSFTSFLEEQQPTDDTNEGRPPKVKVTLSDGIFIQFGLGLDNKLVLILSIVHHARPDPADDSIREPLDKKTLGTLYNYYIPTHPNDGTWELIEEIEAKTLTAKFVETNIDGIAKTTKIKGYFIGRELIKDICLNQGRIKIYLGLYEGNEISNYENEIGLSIRPPLNLQLILVEKAKSPGSKYIEEIPFTAPLASYTRIFSTIECDRKIYEDGWLWNNSENHINGSASCIKPSDEGFRKEGEA